MIIGSAGDNNPSASEARDLGGIIQEPIQTCDWLRKKADLLEASLRHHF